MKKLLPMLLFFLVPAVSFGQGSAVNDVAFKNLITGIAPAAGATVTVCTSAGTGIPCSPQATVYSDIALTQPITPPILADSNGYYSFFAPSGTYIVTVTGAGTSGRSVTYTLPFTLSGSNAFTGNNTHSGTETFNGAATFNGPSHVNFNGGVGTITFTGGNPWADIKDPLYGAKCDGVTDDTNAIQTAMNNVALFASGAGSRNGGTVFIQPNTSNVCLVSSLNMDNMINVEVLSGFVDGSQSGNTVIQFTGTCNPNACLSMRSTAGINFRGVQLKFPNATQGPMIDMQHCAAGVGCFGQDTGYDGFHGVRFDGPGSTIGPIIFADQVDLITFDAWSSFNNASVFVSGPTNNARFSDMVIFDKVVFNQPGTAAIQNASVNWRFSSVFYGINSGNCIPFLQYVGGYTGMQALAINSSEFHMPGVACGNAFSLISIPAASTNLGGLFFNSNLVLQAVGATGTVLNIGNNQSVTANGNMFQNWPVLFSVGTGVSMSVGSNIYTGNAAFLSGTLATGVYQDMTGAINFNSGSNNFNVTNSTLTGPQLASNIATGTAPLVVTSTTAVPNLKVQNVSAVAGGLLPSAVNTTDVGSTALPFKCLLLGTAATNNFNFCAPATAAQRNITWTDPLGPATLPLDASSTYVPATNVFTGAWICTNVTPVTANANVSTDQNLMACTIPAGVLNRVGRTLRVWVAGVYTTPAASVSQMTVKVKLCTVSGCGSGTVITPISIQSTALASVQVTNDNWSLEERSTTQTAGASSAYEAHGDLLIDLTNLTTGADSTFGDTNTATVGTIDSTAQLFLQCTFTFSTASASNSVTQRQLIAETVN